MLGTGIQSAIVTGHFGHAPEDAAVTCTSSFARRSPHTTEDAVLIPEALHFTAAVRWLRYHSHLAAHYIALSRMPQTKGCEEKSVDNAYWLRKELSSSLAVVAEMASSCELWTATPGGHGDHQS